MEDGEIKKFEEIQNRSHSSCAAGGCTNTRQKKPLLSFFMFPRDLKRCSQWMKNSRRLYPNKKTIDIARNPAWLMCEEHFEASQFMNPAEKGVRKKYKRLMPNAIPTLFKIPNRPPRTRLSLTRKLPTRHALRVKKKGISSNSCPFPEISILNDPHAIKNEETAFVDIPAPLHLFPQIDQPLHCKCSETSQKKKMKHRIRPKTKISKEINFSRKNCAQNHEDSSYIKNSLVKIKQFYHLKSRNAENLLKYKNIYRKENDIQNEQNNQCQNNLKSTKEELLRCNICGKEFLSLINVLGHKYKFCKARLTRINFMKTLLKSKVSVKRKYQCNLCERNLFNVSYLRTHLFMHIGKRPFSCKICFESFYIKSYLQNHVKIHTEENIFQNKTCKRNFNSYLDNYEEHNGEYEFFYCHICRKNFQTEIALIIHGISHSEAKFHCDI